MRLPRFIFFDLDGTLSDPWHGIVNCMRHALEQLDIAIENEDELRAYIGPPLHQSFREICGDEELAQEALALYRERYGHTGIYENRLYDGIESCLDELAASASVHYVVTSKPTVFSQQIVEHFRVDHHFKAVYGSNLDGSLADKTELIAHILEREAVDPRDTVMIGDRKFDIIGASNHGIRSIGVLWGYGGEQELREAGADDLCEHPRQLRRCLLG